jgi:hypothetical protein
MYRQSRRQRQEQGFGLFAAFVTIMLIGLVVAAI